MRRFSLLQPHFQHKRPRAQMAAIFAAYDRRGIGRVPGKWYTQLVQAHADRKITADRLRGARWLIRAVRSGLKVKPLKVQPKIVKTALKTAQKVLSRHRQARGQR